MGTNTYVMWFLALQFNIYYGVLGSAYKKGQNKDLHSTDFVNFIIGTSSPLYTHFYAFPRTNNTLVVAILRLTSGEVEHAPLHGNPWICTAAHSRLQKTNTEHLLDKSYDFPSL